MPVELSRWMRISLVVILAVVAAGAAAYGYRYFTTPVVFTLTVGSADGEAASVMKTIAARLASTKAPVRLKVIDTGTMRAAAQQFADRKADLAIVRADLSGLADARSVVIVAHGVVMLLVPPDSTIDSIAKLKGKTVGVVGGDINASLLQALDKGYDLTASHVHFKDLDLQEAPKAVASKAVSALVVVAPVTPHYILRCPAIPNRSRSKQPALSPRSCRPSKATISPKVRCAGHLPFLTMTSRRCAFRSTSSPTSPSMTIA